MNDLPDVNVWLALVDKRHVHHPAASRYWADASVQSRAFCRITANGFLRLCSHASAMPNPLRDAEMPNVPFMASAGGMQCEAQSAPFSSAKQAICNDAMRPSVPSEMGHLVFPHP